MPFKKFILIVSIIVILAVVGWFLYLNIFVVPPEEVSDRLDDDVDNLFPFGSGERGVDVVVEFDDKLQDPDEPNNEERVQKYIRISSAPTAGAGWVKSSDFEGLLYVDRATGHISSFNTETLERKRLSNTTVPKIHEAIFRQDGEGVVLRYLNEETDVIETFSAEIKISESDLGELNNGVFMLNGIESIVSSPTTDKLFYLVRRSSGVGGISADFNNSNKDELVTLGIKDWNLQWFDNNHISFTTKPSAVAEGFMYFLNTSTESFNKMLGGVDGLTTNTSGDGSKVLYSESFGSGFSSFIYNITNSSLKKLYIKTLPEKCVWDNVGEFIYCGVPGGVRSNTYPDAWYQGVVSFSDEVWSINTETFETTKILSPTDVSGVSVDIINPVISSDNDWVFFINKKDLSLWGLKLK